MANDKMAIVCSLCKKGIGIAKYYPRIGNHPVFEMADSGWGIGNPTPADDMNRFFAEHAHDFDFGFQSGQQYFLGYESDNKDWKFQHFEPSETE